MGTTAAFRQIISFQQYIKIGVTFLFNKGNNLNLIASVMLSIVLPK